MIPNPHACAPPLPIIAAAATGSLVIAIISAVLVAVALVALVMRHRLPPGVVRAATWLCGGAFMVGVLAGVLAALLGAKC